MTLNWIATEITEFDKLLDDLVAKTGPQGFQDTAELLLNWWTARLVNAQADFDSMSPEQQKSDYGQRLLRRIKAITNILPRYENCLTGLQQLHALLLQTSNDFDDLVVTL